MGRDVCEYAGGGRAGIVSEVAETTRDSIMVRFEMDGKQFVAIDTPGLRQPKAFIPTLTFTLYIGASSIVGRTWC